MRNLVLLTIVTIFLISCSPRQANTPIQQPEYIEHTITHSGETLGLISAWYTGSSANWPTIANANPGLQVKNLRMGDTVRIPKEMARRNEPLPAEFISKSSKTEAQQVMAMNEDSSAIDSSAVQPPTSDASLPEGLVVSEGVTIKPIEKGPNNDLWMAVMTSDPAAVKTAVAAGADANYIDNGRPMLAWAAQNGNAAVVQALIDAKADLNAVDGIGHTALMRAADMSQHSVLEVLVKAGADLNHKTAEGKSALSLAVSNSSLESVRILAKAGADVNVVDNDGYAPILTAAQNGSVEIINELAAAKADLNFSNIIYTPLVYAIEQENKDLTEVLLKAGANPNAKSKNGRVPLIVAINNQAIFDLLLTHKADPNLTNEFGETALMVAIQNDSKDRIEQLIKAGANVNAKDSNGGTALTLANNMYKPEIVELLKKNGATE